MVGGDEERRRPPDLRTEAILMLILARRQNEVIDIQGLCRVIVVEIRQNAVRLGFEADPAIRIHREEVLKRIVEEEQKRKKA